jgi:hypothetical protein
MSMLAYTRGTGLRISSEFQARNQRQQRRENQVSKLHIPIPSLNFDIEAGYNQISLSGLPISIVEDYTIQKIVIQLKIKIYESKSSNSRTTDY